MVIEIQPNYIKYDRNIQKICWTLYPGHSYGCPNAGKKECCPPQPLINEIMDFSRPIFLVYTVFNVGQFAERMRANHPEWKNYPRQWYNIIRWQGKARKEHKEELRNFLEKHKDYVVFRSPEAHGVNVNVLMKKVGIDLNWDWPPKHILKNKEYLKNTKYQVSLAGILKNQEKAKTALILRFGNC